VGDAPISTTTSPLNLAHLADHHPADRVALISRNLPTTYGELRDQAAKLRGGLTGLGVAPGDRVAILCGNTRQFVISYLATVGVGAIAVPLNPASPAPELERELIAVEPVALTRHDRGDDVHERHRGCVARRHAQPREPARQHRAGSQLTGAHRTRRRRVRRAPPVPHLRAERHARDDRGAGRDPRAGAALRPVDRRRLDPRARRDRAAGGAPHVGGVRSLRRAARRHVRARADRPVGRLQAAGRRCPADRGALRAADRRGVRTHRGVTGRDQLGGPARGASVRVGRSGARRGGRAARDARRRRGAGGRRRRDPGPWAQRVPGVPRRPGDDGARARRRRLVAHGRHGGGRRRRLAVPGRPRQGPHHRVGVQRVPRRGRRGARIASRRSPRPAWSVCPTRTPARR
jgi:hypothetical protein